MNENKEGDTELQTFLCFQKNIIQGEKDKKQLIKTLIEHMLKTP
jgi:hypothetical protein